MKENRDDIYRAMVDEIISLEGMLNAVCKRLDNLLVLVNEARFSDVDGTKPSKREKL